MSLLQDVAKPRVRVGPRWVSNDADDAVFLASAYGFTPDPWQADVLETWLGRQRTGKWAASRCGLAVPRQNGKNGIIDIRELFGMVALGETFLHTAHEVKTARKTFVHLAAFFENERQHPELAALVKDIRKTNGQEAIFLTTGGSVEFVARSRGSARGFTVDVLVLDEAQELKDEELEALKPTISASPLGNPQTIFTGTPPDPETEQVGEVFARFRRGADKARRTAWTDFGVADGPMPDKHDRELWHITNPALGGRLHLDTLMDEVEDMSDEGFARERLGWWGNPLATAAVIDLTAWADTADPESTIVDPVVFAVDVAPDRSTCAVSVAGFRSDGVPHIEVVRYGRGVGWAVAEIERLSQGFVVVDGRSAASSLLPALQAAGIEPLVTSSGDMARACGMFFDAVESRGIRHLGDPVLEKAIRSAGKRPLSDAWAFDRRRGDITPLVSSVLALFGLSTIDTTEKEVMPWAVYA